MARSRVRDPPKARKWRVCVMNNTFTGHNTFIFLFPTRPRAFFLALIFSGCNGLFKGARRGTHRTAFEVFCPCDSASRQLGQLRRGGTPVQPRALSPANLRIDSPPSRSAFQTVPGHPEADEAGCCVDIAGLGETGVDGQFQLRRGGSTPIQPCAPSPANVRTHPPPSRSTHQSIPDH